METKIEDTEPGFEFENKTRGGYPCKVYSTEIIGEYCILGAINFGDGWESASWKKDGSFKSNGPTNLDLVKAYNSGGENPNV